VGDDFLTTMALVGFLADRSQPDCGCKLTIKHEPATPENKAIRDATYFTTDASGCSIARHRNPFGSADG
jgi:hypothetical protein